MKYAVLADIHANLEAFQAVLQDAKTQAVTNYAFLGDFVGYCADPKKCVEIVREMNSPCVRGNHDEYCAADFPLNGFSPAAIKAVEWTRKQLSDSDRQWLLSLPYVQNVEDFTIVHATLSDPERWQYVFDQLAAAASLAHQRAALCFFGHTHMPVAFVRDQMVRGGTYTKLKLESGKQYFLNPGAVGQPRDNNPKAAYAVYDSEARTIELRRVEYDVATARAKIRAAGLSGRLGGASDE